MPQPTSFGEWVKRVARDLSVQRDELAAGTPGSFSEAAAYLTSPEVLGPKEDGLPGAYSKADDEDYIVVAAYASAFVPPDDYSGTVDVLFSTDHPTDESFVDVVVVVWERTEGGDDRYETARVVASRRNVPLTAFACADLEGLRRLYELVGSSQHAG